MALSLALAGVVVVTEPSPTWIVGVKCFWASHGRIIIFQVVVHNSRLEEGKDKSRILVTSWILLLGGLGIVIRGHIIVGFIQEF